MTSEMIQERIETLNAQPRVDSALPAIGRNRKVYTVPEIQDILDIGQNTAYTLVRRKLFHSVQIGDHIRISKKSFDRWLKQNIA